MTATIQLGEVVIAMTTKAIKHVHLSVHPPLGRVTLVAPMAPASKSPGPMRLHGSAGFAPSRPSFTHRRAKRRVSL